VGVIEDIGDGPVALDTVVFIYFIEEHPKLGPLVDPLFTAIDAGALEAVTSGLTLLETLVAPYRAGNDRLAERYEALLTRSRGLRFIDLDRPLLRVAARLRASLGVKTPDSLQLAAALAARCTAYLTNDRALPPVPRLRVLQLRDYLPAT
jgi:predicted nucleic acid-binding protein